MKEVAAIVDCRDDAEVSRLHDDEVDTSVDLVRRLLYRQHPRWAQLPIKPVVDRGTDHAIYRLGDELAVRLPTIHWAASQPAKEARWLPVIAPYVDAELPVPYALGAPDEGFPYAWSVVPWLVGDRATESALPDTEALIDGIATFVDSLRQVDSTGGPSPIDVDRALLHRDARMREAIDATSHVIDARAVTESWEQSLEAPAWNGTGAWVHGDLAEGNVLARDGRVTGVIDWGAACVADPARDVLCAWTFRSGRHASRFREAFRVDDATWVRARGFALAGMVVGVSYYWESDRRRVEENLKAIRSILTDDR